MQIPSPSPVHRFFTRAAWIVFFSLTIWFIWRGNARVEQGHYGDFRHFYWAAEALNHHENPYLSGQKHINEDDGKPERNGYIYPPLIAFFYMPIAPLSMNGAGHVAVTVNVLLIFGGILLLSGAVLHSLPASNAGILPAAPPALDYFKAQPQPLIAFLNLPILALCTALLGFDKIKSEVQMLQTNATIFFAWALAFFLLRKRPFLAGIALGVAFNVKYQVIGLFPYFLIRRQWKAFFGMVAGVAFFALLPGTAVGFANDIAYCKEAFSGILRLVGIPVAGVMADVEPMSSGFSVSIPAGLARAQETYHLSYAPMIVMAIIALVWVALMMLWYRRHNVPVFPRVQSPLIVAAEVAALMGATLAFSPQTNPRHTILSFGVDCMGVALIFLCKSLRMRIAIGASLLIMLVGLSFSANTPGSFFDTLAYWWFFFALATWSVLAASTVTLCSAVSADGMTRATPQPRPDNERKAIQ